MQAKIFFPASLALAILLAGCTATPPMPPDNRVADAKVIRNIESVWSQTFTTRDVDKITSYYAQDASVFMTGMPVITGKSNIASAMAAMMKDKNFTLSFATSTVVVSRTSDMAYTQGAYLMTETNPKTKKPVSEKGKYVTVYMKQAGGSWKAVADINNADGPQTPVKPASQAKHHPAAKRHR